MCRLFPEIAHESRPNGDVAHTVGAKPTLQLIYKMLLGLHDLA